MAKHASPETITKLILILANIAAGDNKPTAKAVLEQLKAACPTGAAMPSVETVYSRAKMVGAELSRPESARSGMAWVMRDLHNANARIAKLEGQVYALARFINKERAARGYEAPPDVAGIVASFGGAKPNGETHA